MSLADRLSEYPAAEEPSVPPSRVEFDGGRGHIETTVQGDTPRDIGPILRECLLAAGHDPDTVRIGAKLKESHWQQRARKLTWSDKYQTNVKCSEFETVWLHCYKFETFLGDAAPTSAAIEEIIRSARVERRPATGPHWFVFQAGDLQIGKRSRDGSTAEIVERFAQSVDAAVDKFRELKPRGVEGIQVSFPGDCIEGNQSQKGQNLWLTQETITEQVLMFQRLIMLTVEAFAPLTERVFVDVVNGNHDQAQRQQNTYPGDGWATKAATSVWDALKLSPLAFGHVDIRVPEKWSGHMTVPVGDTVVTVAHGHQWSRDKAFDWWAKQAIGNQAPAGAHLLQHGHWHEWMVRSNAERIVVCSPTFDCGSDWYREKKGATSRRGAVAYLLRSGEVTDMGIV